MADYTVEYYHEYYDINGTLHRIELLLLEYSGGSTCIEKGDAIPVRMRHTGSKTKFEETIIQGQELIFSFNVARDDVDTFDTLFESDYKDYKVKYYVGGQLEFESYVKPENLSKQFSKNPPYVRITLSATDALADLKKVPFGDGEVINDKLTILEILKEALTPIGITFDFQIQLGTYESTYMPSTECVLKEIVVDTRRFFTEKTGKREFMSCWQVIEAVLKDFNVTFKQRKEKYQITNHNESNSHQFIFDWTTLTQQSRLVTDNIVDMTGYKYDPAIEQQKVRPLKMVGIIHKNKDFGEDVIENLDDWSNGAIWTIDFSNGYSVADGVVTLKSNDDTYDDYVETAAFAVQKNSEKEYLKITFDHILDSLDPADSLMVPMIKITITRPDSSTVETFFFIKQEWDSYESTVFNTLKVVSTGNYQVKLSFEQAPGSWTTAEFKLKNFHISKIVNIEEGEDISDVVFDKYYKQTSNKGIEIFETETLLADAGQITEIGSLLYDDAGTWKNTGTWRTYGHTEDIKLLDIYARNILNNRYDYKNYLRTKISDRDNNIDFDKILTILSKNYVFISYDRNFKECFVTAELVELLTIQKNYNDIFPVSLNSINGEKVTGSINVNPVTPSSTPYHNELGGLYGASPYNHLGPFGLDNQIPFVNAGRDDFDYSENLIFDGTTLTITGDVSADNFYGDGASLTNVGAAAADALTILAKAAENITKGKVVYVSGVTGNMAQVSLADNTHTDKHFVIGMAAETKTTGQNILIRVRGELTGINTDAFAAGDKMYLSTGGDIIVTEPTTGAIELIGYVTVKAINTGEVVLIHHSSHDITVPSTDDIIIRMGDNAGANKVSFRDYANNEVASIDSDGDLTVSEGNLTFATNVLKQYSDEVGKTDWRFTIYTGDADAMRLYNYDEGETAYRNMILGNSSNFLYLDLANTRVGINDATPSYTLDINGTGRFVGNLYADANVENLSFVTGFQGDKWQMTEDGNWECENLFVRGGLTVYELILNRLRYQCGGLIIGAGGGKISEVVDATVGAEQLFFEDPEGNNMIPFTVGAIVMIQDFDLNRTTVVKRVVRQVSALTDVAGKWRIDLTTTVGAPANVGIFAVGDEMVSVGHVSDTALDASIYMSAVDSNNPFLRILDGVDTWAKWSLGSNTGLRLQIGNLNGTYGYSSEIYGFAAGDPNNEYMTVDPTNGIRFFNDAGTKVAELAGASFLVGGSGSNRIEFDGTTFTIVATTYDLSASNLSITSATGIEIGNDFWKNDKTFQFGGGILNGTDSAVNIAGWTAKATSLYTGTEHLTDDWSTTGTTLANDSSIHTPNFYVNVGGEIGLRQVESVLFKQDGDTFGIKMSGSSIWEDIYNGISSISINVKGYQGGSAQFRRTNIGNGKGSLLAQFDGNSDQTNIYSLLNVQDDVDITGYIDVTADNASGYAGYFFNDGNNDNRYGIGIQCGVDSPTAESGGTPIKFFDGTGTPIGMIWFDSGSITLSFSSDISLKEHIEDYNINGLNIIEQMQYRSFNWKKDPDKHEVHGWVADEVEKIYSEMVSVDPETGYKMIGEAKLIPVMMAGIKELNERIKILESQKN